ncbi:Tannase and feruloyl esterase [Bryocella elongata]|uniref:Tannase and feruloyl esterase n=1 Tax=Bryocella elongata TaxID=863522 RepID=A0A1H5VRK5_9BACT|nr:tannase/feruloyl esterase family alpha/beta hydrolase [Bryocella elongata]SEF89870.1 Tannase and feruloyl esterase [Bryocella elongata]
MKHENAWRSRAARIVAVFGTLIGLAPAHAAIRCEDLRQVEISQMNISAAEVVPAGGFHSAMGFNGLEAAKLPEFCRVTVVAHPSAQSHIGIEVWLPTGDWNGKFLGTGNGGFAGHIAYRSLADGLRSHYAVANTDTGTSPDAGYFTSREEVKDWAFRSVHQMTIAAQSLVKAFYGKPPKERYFSGCSSGGQEGLTEAQRFPDDYDGILAGAPANDRVDLHVALLWNWRAMHRADGTAIFSSEQLLLLSAMVAKSCPSVNGVVMNPAVCAFDVAQFKCRRDDHGEGCFTGEQIAAIRNVYNGPEDPKSQRRIYPGLAYGSESQWTALLPTEHGGGAMPYDALLRAALGAEWHGVFGFRFGQDTEAVERDLSTVVNATDPNLDAFRSHGGKLLLTHGWADPVIAPGGSIRYVDELRKRYGADVNSFLRFYLVPGEAHCGGGPGPSTYEGLGILADWVERGKAPSAIQATGGSRLKEALLCPYPQRAVLKGAGVPDEARSYACVSP